jgi:hypothetical protein
MNAFTFFVVCHRCSQEPRKSRRAGAASSAAAEPGPQVQDGVKERGGAVAQEARRTRGREEGAGRGSEAERRTTQWRAWRWQLGASVSLPGIWEDGATEESANHHGSRWRLGLGLGKDKERDLRVGMAGGEISIYINYTGLG